MKLVKKYLSQLISIFRAFSKEFCKYEGTSLQNDENLKSIFLCSRDMIQVFYFLSAIRNGEKQTKNVVVKNLNIN